MFDKKFLKDLGERVLVTVILSAIGIGLVYADKLDPAVAVAVVALLNVVKAAVAKQFGNPDSAGFVNDLPDQIVKAATIPPTDTRTPEQLAERAEFEEDDDVELCHELAPLDPADSEEEAG